MVSRKDYTAKMVKAAQSVLIELMHLLGEYRDHIVIIGGWVPEFLIPKRSVSYVGSLDVDLALDHRKISSEGYKSIQELLFSRGYEQGSQPFIFYRKVLIEGREAKVQIDLLSGEYEGTGKGHRHQKIQEIHVRKARGCDIAFDNPVHLTIEGELPEGGKSLVEVQVASIVTFLVMKGMALNDRLKEKDAWDIYYCVRNYPKGLDALIEEFKPYSRNSLVREGLEKIAKHFASEQHIGPKFVADFEEVTDIEEREFLQRDAYERINYLLKKIKVK